MPTCEPVFTALEVALHNKADDAWLILDGRIYDVSHFVEDHPGGPELLLNHAGGDISEQFDAIHRHSPYARMQLEEYRIGLLQNYGPPLLPERRAAAVEGVQQAKPNASFSKRMVEIKDDAFLDLNQPLMPQVWNNRWSKRYYLEQVHIPRHTTTSPRFFPSSLLEIFTKTTWYAVLLLWIPIICGCLRYALTRLPSAMVVQLFLDGLFLWTVFEYVFHRHVFHMERLLPENRYAFVLHFLAHGVHHFLPMDRLRLVMPPLLLATLSTPVIWTMRQFAS